MFRIARRRDSGRLELCKCMPKDLQSERSLTEYSFAIGDFVEPISSPRTL